LFRKSRAKAAGVSIETKTQVLFGILSVTVLLPCAVLQGTVPHPYISQGTFLTARSFASRLACALHEPAQATATALISTPISPALAIALASSVPTTLPVKELQRHPTPVQRFQVGESIRVLACTSPGVRPSHATDILSATIVRIKGPNEYLVRAGGADHANSRLVSDEVMVSLLPGMALAPIPSDRRVS